MGSFVQLGSHSLNGYERNKLYRNLGRGLPGADSVPRFADDSYLAGADRIEDGRGAAVTDIDRDGDLDIVVQSYKRPVVLLVNQGQETGNWLQVKLRGTRSNRDALGGRVVIEADGRRQNREVVSSEGYLAGKSRICHFGLGDAERVERLTVIWPSGARTTLNDVAANQRLVVVEESVFVAGTPDS